MHRQMGERRAFLIRCAAHVAEELGFISGPKVHNLRWCKAGGAEGQGGDRKEPSGLFWRVHVGMVSYSLVITSCYNGCTMPVQFNNLAPVPCPTTIFSFHNPVQFSVSITNPLRSPPFPHMLQGFSLPSLGYSWGDRE